MAGALTATVQRTLIHMATELIINGDALTELKRLESNSLDCVVTSPPYYRLRDYQIDGQIGLENSMAEYLQKLIEIFDEVRRVLKKKGICFVNLGDTYALTGKTDTRFGDEGKFSKISKKTLANCGRGRIQEGYPSKCLMLIPERFIIEMVNHGWIVRNEIIWHKPNAMPSSIKDRFTVDFEKIYFLTKSKKYYFNQILEDAIWKNDPRLGYGRLHYRGKREGQKGTGQENFVSIKEKRNKRSVWSVSTKPFKEAHFATFPEKLIEPLLECGCPENGVVLDPFFGAGTTGLVARKQNKGFIGIELNKNYIDIANKRLSQTNLIPNSPLTASGITGKNYKEVGVR